MDLTPKNIFNLVDGQVLMEKYFPGVVVVGPKYINPFRNDTKAGCFFTRNSKGQFLFCDYPHPESGGDAIQILMLDRGISFTEALATINEDFGLGLTGRVARNGITTITPVRNYGKKKEVVSKIKRTVFQIKLRNWNEVDREYWGRFGITLELLNTYSISPVDKYLTKVNLIDHYSLSYTHKDTDPCYCYRFRTKEDERVKLYRPLTKNKVNKWRSNITPNIIQGLSQLPFISSVLIVASSMKDLLTLVAAGFTDVIAPQSETVNIPEGDMELLKHRYKRIIYIFDADATGTKNAREFAELYDCEYRSFENEFKAKDFAELREQVGENLFTTFVTQLLNE